MPKILNDIKAVFKMAFADVKVDILPMIKPLLGAIFVVGMAYVASYLIDTLKFSNAMFFVNLGMMNNFALFIFIFTVSFFYSMKIKNDEIKKLKKELEEWK